MRSPRPAPYPFFERGLRPCLLTHAFPQTGAAGGWWASRTRRTVLRLIPFPSSSVVYSRGEVKRKGATEQCRNGIDIIHCDIAHRKIYDDKNPYYFAARIPGIPAVSCLCAGSRPACVNRPFGTRNNCADCGRCGSAHRASHPATRYSSYGGGGRCRDSDRRACANIHPASDAGPRRHR